MGLGSGSRGSLNAGAMSSRTASQFPVKGLGKSLQGVDWRAPEGGMLPGCVKDCDTATCEVTV